MYNEGGSFAEGYAIGRDSVSGNGFFGGDFGWWILILLFLGYGNGFGGNNGGFMGGYDLGKLATTNDVATGFSTSSILNNLNDLKLGQAGLQQTLCQGFNGVNTSILTSANSLQSQLADCCCGVQRSIDGVNYNMAKNTCDIIQSGKDNTQRIVDFLTNDKISSLQAENAALTSQLSQFNQTNNIINALRPIAQPAYLTCSPFQSVYGNSCCGC